jgi:hypothetical protein
LWSEKLLVDTGGEQLGKSRVVETQGSQNVHGGEHLLCVVLEESVPVDRTANLEWNAEVCEVFMAWDGGVVEPIGGWRGGRI